MQMASTEGDTLTDHQREESFIDNDAKSPIQALPESDNVGPPVDSSGPVSEELRKGGQTLSRTAQDFSDKVVQYIQNIEKFITEFENQKTEIYTLQQKITAVETEKAALQETVESLQLDETRIRQEGENEWKEKLERQEKEVDRHRREYRERTAKLTKQFESELYILQQKVIDAEREKDALKSDIERLHLDERRKGQESEQEMKEMLESRERQVSQINRENEDLKTRFTSLDHEERKKDEEVEDGLRPDEEDSKDVKTRVHKVRSTKLTGGNPNIADDLGDSNGPTKIAERYMELYDNQLKDAFAIVQEQKKRCDPLLKDDELEKEAVSVLLHTLMDAWQFCKDEIHEQDIHVKETILRTPDSQHCLPDEFLKHLQSTKKILAVHTAEPVFHDFMARKQTVKGFGTSCIETYVKECVTLCWLMANQDPQVEFELTTKPDDEFDTKKYRDYMKTGSYIDFVILPPMLLSGDVSVLAKGVAQGKQIQHLGTKDSPNVFDNRNAYQQPQVQRDGFANKHIDYIDGGLEPGYNLHQQRSEIKRSPIEIERVRKHRIVETVNVVDYNNTHHMPSAASRSDVGGGYMQEMMASVSHEPRHEIHVQTPVKRISPLEVERCDTQETATPDKDRNAESGNGAAYNKIKRKPSKRKTRKSDVGRGGTHETMAPEYEAICEERNFETSKADDNNNTNRKPSASKTRISEDGQGYTQETMAPDCEASYKELDDETRKAADYNTLRKTSTKKASRSDDGLGYRQETMSPDYMAIGEELYVKNSFDNHRARRKTSSTKRSSSDTGQGYKQKTMTPVDHERRHQSTAEMSPEEQYDAYTDDEQMPTEKEFRRYLEYYSLGWPRKSIRNVLGDSVYDRCLYMHRGMEGYA